MTWTYNPSQLGSTPLYQVRFLIGDTIEGQPQLQDEEINWTLTQQNSIWGAASMCAQSVASEYSRRADTVQMDLRTTYSQISKQYASMAAQYANKSAARGGGLPVVTSVSITDKNAEVSNPDRVPPQFQIGMDDNYLPLPDPGNMQLEGSGEP